MTLPEPASVIMTERMVLRPPRPSDAGPMSLYCADVRVARMTSSIPHPYPPEAAAAFVEQVTAGRHRDRVWVMDASPSDGAELVGVLSLSPKRELGYWVGPPFWNTGLATEAVRGLIQHLRDAGLAGRLEAVVFTDNFQSARVLEKCGFARTGQEDGYSLARNAPAPHWRYRLDTKGARA